MIAYENNVCFLRDRSCHDNKMESDRGRAIHLRVYPPPLSALIGIVIKYDGRGFEFFMKYDNMSNLVT